MCNRVGAFVCYSKWCVSFTRALNRVRFGSCVWQKWGSKNLPGGLFERFYEKHSNSQLTDRIRLAVSEVDVSVKSRCNAHGS